VIDLVVVFSGLAPFCHSYTDYDSAGSDHFPVIAYIGGTTKKCQFKYKLKISKKDAPLFSHNLVGSFDSFASNMSTDTIHAYDQLDNHIRQQVFAFTPLNARFPKSEMANGYPRSPPWNADCQAAVDMRRRATKNYINLPTSSNFQAYKRARSSCSKTVKRMKRHS